LQPALRLREAARLVVRLTESDEYERLARDLLERRLQRRHRLVRVAEGDDGVREAEIGLGVRLVPGEAGAEPVDRLAVVLLLVVGLAEVAGGDLRRGVGGVV